MASRFSAKESGVADVVYPIATRFDGFGRSIEALGRFALEHRPWCAGRSTRSCHGSVMRFIGGSYGVRLGFHQCSSDSGLWHDDAKWPRSGFGRVTSCQGSGREPKRLRFGRRALNGEGLNQAWRAELETPPALVQSTAATSSRSGH